MSEIRIDDVRRMVEPSTPRPRPDAPPYDGEAEGRVIGAAMVWADVAAAVAQRPDIYYYPFHARCAEAIANLVAMGATVDPTTVLSELRRRGVDLVPADLISLQAGAAMPGAALRLLDVVADCAHRRRVGALAVEVRERAYLGQQDVAETAAQLAELAAAFEDAGRRHRVESLVLRWVEDAVESPPDEPPVLVDGFLRAGELVVLGAPRAIGKSWVAMQLAVLLGRGEGRFLGALRVARPARVLLAQGELDPWGSAQRWRTLTGTEGPPAGVAETFERFRLRVVQVRSAAEGGTETWHDARLDERLEATIAAEGFDVLILDPWAVFYAGNENSNDEVEAALDKLRDLAMRHNVAVVILHHIGKGGGDDREPEDMWRGASRLADWASTRVTLLPHFTDRQAAKQGMDRRSARRYVDVKFLRRGAPTDDFSVVFNPMTGWFDRWGTPAEAAAERVLRMHPVDVAEACADAGGDWPSVVIAADDLGCSQAVARRHLAAAVQHGYLVTYAGQRGARGHRLPPEEPA